MKRNIIVLKNIDQKLLNILEEGWKIAMSHVTVTDANCNDDN